MPNYGELPKLVLMYYRILMSPTLTTQGLHELILFCLILAFLWLAYTTYNRKTIPTTETKVTVEFCYCTAG